MSVSPITIFEEAQSAYRAGLCILPVARDGSKRPDVRTWTPYQRERPTSEQMRAFQFERRHGFGMIAGLVSGRRGAWDFDCPDTYRAFVEAANASGLGKAVRRIEAGYCDETPAGGRRWIVQYAERVVWRDTTLARRPGGDREPKIRTLIELPTFAILAPSHGATHPSGRPYLRASGSFHTIAAVTAEEHADLVALARTFDAMRRPHARERGITASAGNRPGDVFNRSAHWRGILEPAGWCHVLDRGDVAYWRRPGKTHGVSATTNLGGRDRLYVFTSSTPFEPEQSYSKFAAYAVLYHTGDFATAARSLAQQGFGPSENPADASSATAPAPTHDAASRTLQLTPASQITVRPVRWLWEDRLPLGTLGLLGGREGIGKTICAYTLGAAITRGTLPGVYVGAPRAVIVAATEDSWEHTIVPRLMAADADLARVYRVDVITADPVGTTLSLPRDLLALKRAARDVQAALIILDPLLSRLDTALDTHKDAEVRVALEPLVTLADATRTCVLGLIHVNKSSSNDVLTMLMASRAFPAVARAVLFVMVDPEEETVRLLGQPKNNLGRTDLPTLRFRIVGVRVADTPEGAVWTGKLEWLGVTDRSIQEAIVAANEQIGDRTATQEAADWLDDYLTSQGGTRDSATIKQQGKQAGYSADSLKRARRQLRIVSAGRGFPRRSYWSLPSQASAGESPTPTAPTAPTDPTFDKTDSSQSGPVAPTGGPMGAVGAVRRVPTRETATAMPTIQLPAHSDRTGTVDADRDEQAAERASSQSEGRSGSDTPPAGTGDAPRERARF